MKNIYTRKIVLLSSIAVLLVVYILQISFFCRSKVKTVYTKEEIDSVEVTKNGEHILSLKKENEKWLVENFPAMENRANRIVNSVNEIKILSTVSYDLGDLERYGLTDENAVKVVASSGGKVERVLYVGKDSVAGSQCYVRIDDEKKICLAQGSLKSTFEVSADEIKEKPKAESQQNEEVE